VSDGDILGVIRRLNNALVEALKEISRMPSENLARTKFKYYYLIK
jgi:hypothetical protein